MEIVLQNVGKQFKNGTGVFSRPMIVSIPQIALIIWDWLIISLRDHLFCEDPGSAFDQEAPQYIVSNTIIDCTFKITEKPAEQSSAGLLRLDTNISRRYYILNFELITR